MVLLSCDILTITASGFASLICNQFEFQASETTLKVTGLCPLHAIITGSTDIIGTALTDIPDPTVCNYLFQSIEITTSPCNSTYLLCFSRQFTPYTAKYYHITFLLLALSLFNPTLHKALMSRKLLVAIPQKRLLQSYWPTNPYASTQRSLSTTTMSVTSSFLLYQIPISLLKEKLGPENTKPQPILLQPTLPQPTLPQPTLPQRTLTP